MDSKHNFVSISSTKLDQVQGHFASQGQGQIYIVDHTPKDINHINSKQNSLALSEWSSPLKVKVGSPVHPGSKYNQHVWPYFKEYEAYHLQEKNWMCIF